MASSGRYRSNVFNFLTRQSIRLQDQVSQTWRQAKMATVWGAQILLYPLYVGFQATRLVGKQLRQTARQVFPRLRAVVQTVDQPGAEAAAFLFADTPIQRSLQALSDLKLMLPADRLALQLDPQDPSAPGIWVVVGGAIASSLMPSLLPGGESSALSQGSQKAIRLIASLPSSLEKSGLQAFEQFSKTMQVQEAIQIQGIAALLDSHKLVLVDVQNQLLDVLSPEQQMILQRRIAGDVASYWRQQRDLTEAHPWVDRFLPLPKDRTLALPPIRTFWQLMAWMQTSPVAVATNLFQESKLLPSLPVSRSLPEASLPLRSAAAWTTGDQMVENLGQWLRQTWQTFAAPEASHFKGSSYPLLKAAPANGKPHSLTSEPLPSPPTLAERVLQWSRGLRRLPLAAWTNPSTSLLDSHSHQNLPSQDSLSQSLSPQHLPSAPAPRPAQWMQRSLRSLQKQTQVQDIPQDLPQVQVRQPITFWDRSGYSTPQPLQTASPQPPEQFGETQIVSAPGTKISSQSSSAEENELVAKPSWIEAEVRLVAYEKHPIEQLLDWLDRGMTWVEDRVVGVWKWFRDRWSG
ncbi:MAG: hypothetical protein HY785_21065 [Oscillatoriophycideae cyanobacterium NC_groundwater_1537_Pr4_S-0.65um_50_18]|nr:hypothetical protein [Oscillatoriophycideae cyanobacterium NC_groundwater_1537_Pr4_S-0.65um_50_18]